MIDKVRYLFLYVSLLFLLGHTFVYHVHQQGEKATRQLHKAEPAIPQNLLDLLAYIFQQDLGEDHLNHFEPAKQALFQVVPVFIEINWEIMFSHQAFLCETISFMPFQEMRYDTGILSVFYSRGPPR